MWEVIGMNEKQLWNKFLEVIQDKKVAKRLREKELADSGVDVEALKKAKKKKSKSKKRKKRKK